ncbi:MAG TPA: hypothetical protein PLO89_12275, partial [Spirochaetota bacterium]|nr:hypothetical protein [Spirochaetota bacterium]
MLLGAVFASAFVSLIIVFFARHLDKNNRSFDKIARLGKNIKDDIENLVSEKVQYLKDFDNCIEVSSQKANYILDNLNKSIYELQDKVKDLDGEKEKISSFYKKIEIIDKDIALISDQASEIKESSDFFKSAMEKVNKFKKDVAFLEKDIGRVYDEFKKENALSLKNLSNSIINDVSMQVDTVRRELQGLYESSEEKNNFLVEDMNRKVVEFDNRFMEKDRVFSEYIEEQSDIIKSKIVDFSLETKKIEDILSGLKENFINLVIGEFNNLNDINNAN